MDALRFPSSLLLALAFLGCGGKAAPTSTTPAGGEAGGAAASSSSTSAPSGDGTATTGDAAGNPSTSSSTSAPSSMSGDVPDEAKAPALASKSECPDKGGCYFKALVPDELKASIDPKSPAFVWEEVLPRKAILSYPASPDVDLYGILLDGEVSVMAPDIKDKQKRLWKMNAFRAPGGGVTIVAKEPTRAILAVVAKKPGVTIQSIVDATAKKPLPLQWSGVRSSPVVAVELPSSTDLAWGGGAYHVRIAFPNADADPGAASLELLMASKDAPVKEHTHDKEWELMAVLEGAGTLTKAGAGTTVKAGALVSVPPGVAHAWAPDGSSPLVAVQMYVPPGPEQRFKKLAADAK